MYEQLQIQKYMEHKNFDQKLIQLLFCLRTRMVKVKANFKNLYSNTICELCLQNEETQSHLLECEVLIEKCPELFNDVDVEYEDIFSNTTKQLKAVKLFSAILEVRKSIVDETCD